MPSRARLRGLLVRAEHVTAVDEIGGEHAAPVALLRRRVVRRQPTAAADAELQHGQAHRGPSAVLREGRHGRERQRDAENDVPHGRQANAGCKRAGETPSCMRRPARTPLALDLPAGAG